MLLLHWELKQVRKTALASILYAMMKYSSPEFKFFRKSTSKNIKESFKSTHAGNVDTKKGVLCKWAINVLHEHITWLKIEAAKNIVMDCNCKFILFCLLNLGPLNI